MFDGLVAECQIGRRMAPLVQGKQPARRRIALDGVNRTHPLREQKAEQADSAIQFQQARIGAQVHGGVPSHFCCGGRKRLKKNIRTDC